MFLTCLFSSPIVKSIPRKYSNWPRPWRYFTRSVAKPSFNLLEKKISSFAALGTWPEGRKKLSLPSPLLVLISWRSRMTTAHDQPPHARCVFSDGWLQIGRTLVRTGGKVYFWLLVSFDSSLGHGNFFPFCALTFFKCRHLFSFEFRLFGSNILNFSI